MAEFVSLPNLPLRAGEVIIGEKYFDILENPLKKLGIDAAKVPDNPCVDKRLSGHADLSVLHRGGKELLLAPYLKGSKFAESMQKRGFEVSFADIVQQAEYPLDAQLNCCVAGKNIIAAPTVSYAEIVNYFTIKKGYRMISCKQGYARCSVCVVDENAIITADRGIAAAARENGLEVLAISPGFIALDGFPYGFIGGAAFKMANDTLAFTGTLDQHPDKEAIENFLAVRKIKPVYITHYSIFDIGGALPVTEK